MFEFIAIVGAVQITIALLLWLFGYPSLFATYLAGFRNQEPKKWYDHFFNVFFWIFISLAYYSFLKIAKKNGFFKAKLYYGLGLIGAVILFYGVILPIMEFLFYEQP
ncbi:hypothetical protein MKZ19_20055 [Shouchella clausii]|uniref:hypothetical protein n=1 Tax=Shouchella clausii TaxID=79880 RepID=UPI0031FD6D94